MNVSACGDAEEAFFVYETCRNHVQGVFFSVIPDGVRRVHGSCTDTEIQIILQREVADDFSFAFVSPEGAYDN